MKLHAKAFEEGIKRDMNKKDIRLSLLMLCAFAIAAGGYGLREQKNSIQNNAQSSRYQVNLEKFANESPIVGGGGFTRDIHSIDYSGVAFTPWDVAAASAHISPQDKKNYTIMIYMNGSDLESENGAATDDLIEMLNSGINTSNVNIILFTGGTNRWQNDVVPENECMLWKVTDNQLEELAGVGLVNMGNAGTLSSFIDFSIKNFPAVQYGLILWDHGGGSIAGYGHDENFNNSNLTLLDLDYAFKMSALDKTKLEFLGFDSCLMATVEMAVVASPYARYLVASEDLEPADGWDYSFLSVLNGDPSMDGGRLGIAIADYYMDFYGLDTDEPLTISVVDLTDVSRVMDAMGNLMNRCTASLFTEQEPSFATFARKRYGTKTFGEGSPRDNESDMVDIGDMAHKLSDLFPEEAAQVLSALERSVIYNRHNSNIDLKGLSTYYIYGGKETADLSLPTYAALDMSSDYTGYLYDFANLLNKAGMTRSERNSRSVQENSALSVAEVVCADLTIWQAVEGKQGVFMMTGIQQSEADVGDEETWRVDQNTLWPKINDRYVCLFEINSREGRSLYAVPAEINGRDCDIIILISEQNPDGKILGVRQEDGFIIQKGLDVIEKGDTISFYYPERNFTNTVDTTADDWHKSSAFIVTEELHMEWATMKPDKAYYSLRLTDLYNNQYFTALKRF